jgi:hypothetical protein
MGESRVNWNTFSVETLPSKLANGTGCHCGGKKSELLFFLSTEKVLQWSGIVALFGVLYFVSLKYYFCERSNIQLRTFRLQMCKYKFLRIKLETWYFILCHPVFWWEEKCRVTYYKLYRRQFPVLDYLIHLLHFRKIRRNSPPEFLELCGLLIST